VLRGHDGWLARTLKTRFAAMLPHALDHPFVVIAVCVLMLAGPGMSPARELATALTEQRRRVKSSGPVLVPVDVRDWEALFPPDAPGAVRALIQRLRDEKR